MKKSTKKSCFKTSRKGGVAVALMLIVFSISVLVGGVIKFSLHNLALARRSIDLERARIFAESALDAAAAQVRLAIQEYDLGLIASLDLNSLVAPSFPQSHYDAKILHAEFAPNTPSGFVSTNMHGLAKEFLDIVITAGVSNKITSVTASFQETVRITKERFLRSAIFYDDLLELHPGVNMTVNGDIVCNDAIMLWIGNRARGDKLKLNGGVRAKDGITIFKNGLPWSLESIAKRVFVKVSSGYESFLQSGKVLDSNNPAWDMESMNVWEGRVLTGDRAGTVDLPIEEHVDNHVLIEPPSASDTPRVSKTKLANKADFYVKVKADKTIWVKTSPGGAFSKVGTSAIAQLAGTKDPHGVYDIKPDPTGTKGWINVQTDFYDPRESEASYNKIVKNSGSIKNQRMEVVNIYLDQLFKNYPGRKLIYVEVEDPPAGSGLKPAVRIRNGYDLKPNNGGLGISIASARTGYVEGDFNAKSGLPALIAMDNLTALSSAWNDSKAGPLSHTWDKGMPIGSDTTLNACVMIGYADPNNLIGREKTGGAHNLVRFRERLTKKNYSFLGSYISLWAAQDSHALYSTRFYQPPLRIIKYNPLFKTRQPPFMPNGYSTPIVMQWREINWKTACAVNP